MSNVLKFPKQPKKNKLPKKEGKLLQFPINEKMKFSVKSLPSEEGVMIYDAKLVNSEEDFFDLDDVLFMG